jgi:uncharacterized protein
VRVAAADVAAVERQLGRPPRALTSIAVRCPHGAPAVLEQAPYAEDGTPFPTTYWLSCRALVDAVGRLESHGGIAELEAELAADEELRGDRRRVEARVAARRDALAGPGPHVDDGAALSTDIGGTAAGGGLKCLHAHAAVALACGPYALGERVLQRAGAVYPQECCAWS